MKALQKGKISPDRSLAVPVGNILPCIGFSSSKNLQLFRAFPMCCKKKVPLMTELRELGSQSWVSTSTSGFALLAARSFQSHNYSYHANSVLCRLKESLYVMVAFGSLSDCFLFIKLVPGVKKQETPFSAFQSLSPWPGAQVPLGSRSQQSEGHLHLKRSTFAVTVQGGFEWKELWNHSEVVWKGRTVMYKHTVVLQADIHVSFPLT